MGDRDTESRAGMGDRQSVSLRGGFTPVSGGEISGRSEQESGPVGWISPWAAIGNPPEHRDHRWKYLTGEENFLWPNIHPTAIIESFATIDGGIKTATFIGRKTLVMKHSHVGHDTYVGGYVNIAPGAIIGGHCIIGDGVRIGIGALIRPRTRIGAKAIIGAGAVVVKDVPEAETWAGNPAREIENKRPRLWTAEEEYDAWMEWYDNAFNRK